MTPVPEPLIAVGKDCDCGAPLVWRHGHRWCAVYGSHAPTMGMRDPNAPGAALIASLMAADRYRLKPRVRAAS